MVGPDMPFGSSVDLSSGVMHPGTAGVWGGKKRKSRKHKMFRKAKKSIKRGKHGGMEKMCINYKHKLDGDSDYKPR